MFSKKTLTAIFLTGLFVVGTANSQSIEDNWNDFLHYTKIARLDLAAGYAQAVLDAEPDPLELLSLSEANPQGYAILLKVIDSAPNPELTSLSGKLLDVIERGRFLRRTDPKIIVAEIERLSTTARGRLAAIKRLGDAGEYAIMYMLDAMANNPDKDELANIIWALPQIGRDAIRPLTAALQTENIAVKSEIIKALGKIGYPHSLAYLKYVVEKDSSAELRSLAEKSIAQIDSSVLTLPAAQLFYQLAEDYYYHSESLTPAEDADFGNVWFWDRENQRLVRTEVAKDYFYELMSMRTCEWSLKADAAFGRAIGLWLAGYFKAESPGLEMPEYFGEDHADARVYATTAGPEYLHQALARAIKDENAYVALGVIEALATTAGEKSLLYRLGLAQPLVQSLSFNDRAVKYSAAIAIASAGPKQDFPESKLLVDNLAQALQVQENTDLTNEWIAENYALRAAKVMLKLAQTRNAVVDLSAAQDALIISTRDSRSQIQILSGLILAYLESPDAQRSIAVMALAENNSPDVRVAAFNSLTVSAKLNANLLDTEMLNSIYSLVGSRGGNQQLRSAAAIAYGALNLPSQKVKDLILDQSSS